MLKWFGFTFLFLITVISKANINVDSLKKVWYNVNLSDTVRLNAIHQIAWDGYVFSIPDSAYYFAQLQYDFANKIGFKKQAAKAVNTQGVSLWVKGSYEYAIIFHEKSLEIRREIKDQEGIASSLGNLGLVYTDLGNYGRAIDYFQESLNLSKEIDYKKGIANALDNIGIVLSEQGDFAEAVKNYTLSLKLKEEINDQNGVANSLNNIGVLYLKQKDYEKAIEYYTKSLEIREATGNERGKSLSLNNLGLVSMERKDYKIAMGYFLNSMQLNEKLGDKKGISQASNNIGIIYQKLKEPDKALDYYNKSLKISEEIKDKRSTSIALINIGELLFQLNDYKTAILYVQDALDITIPLGAIGESEMAYNILYKSYKELDEPEKALEMHEKLTSIRDSINSQENKRAMIRQEYKYKYEKEALADSLKAAEEIKLTEERIKRQEAELKQQDLQKMYLGGGIVLLLIFGGITFQRYRKSQKQNKIIEKQKKMVEEAHKEITDSISYAKRIQNAILPRKEKINALFNDAFVLYRPKDVVAGDFYWYDKKENITMLAVADCTGHGVPGALVSVVCHNSLNRSINEFKIYEPGKILDKTRELVLQEFEKSEDDVADGMDIALITIRDNKLQYAGANNPVWILRNNKTIELKPNKQPIGKYTTSTKYSTREFDLQKSDAVYLFTDGYADQFGGPKGKKFMYKPFKSLLISIQSESMAEQCQKLEQTFESWKGKESQVDDVCVIGLRF